MPRRPSSRTAEGDSWLAFTSGAGAAAGGAVTAAGSDFSNLYEGDDKHPSVQGSYLVACVLYATLSGRDPRNLSFKPAEMSTERQAQLQSTAAFTVDQYNRKNAVNQQYSKQRQKVTHGGEINVYKKPYVPLGEAPKNESPRSRRALWFLFFCAAGAATMAAMQRRPLRKMDRTTPLVVVAPTYTPIQIVPPARKQEEEVHDMELVSV